MVGADLVLPHSLVSDCPLLIKGERIASIGPGATRNPQCTEIRLPGKIILPGLIDLHSDAIEKMVEPRPKIFFPIPFAIKECDQRHLTCGITTVFNAIAFAGKEFGVRDPNIADQIVRSLDREPAVLHRRLHLRFEITDVESVPLVEALIQEGKVDLISFMDHSPGQGQYAQDGRYASYLMRTYAMTEREALRLIAYKKESRQSRSQEVNDRLLRAAKAAKIPISGHDLDSLESASEWHQLGATISEFPLNEISARASREYDMVIVMGAPNVIRGASSGGGLRASDGIRQNLIDVLCSDYKPNSLLPALFKVSSDIDIPLPDAVSLATWRAADAVGLTHVGKLAEGFQADLIIVQPTPHGPRLEAVMVSGQWRYLSGQLSDGGGYESQRVR